MYTRILHWKPLVAPENCTILMTGVTSIHGWPLYQSFRSLLPVSNLYAVRPPKMKIPDGDTIFSLCMTDLPGLKKLKMICEPTHVVVCSGVCDLDVCEDRPQWAYAMNVTGAKNIVKVFGSSSHILYASSDLVFSGNKPPIGGYKEEDQPDPVSIAGKTIQKAEDIIQGAGSSCVVRLGLPIGESITGTKGGVDWIEGRFKKNLGVTLFYDEYRSCIDCGEISQWIVQVLFQKLVGLYHLGGEKPVSLYELGCAILERGGYSKSLLKGISRFDERHGPPRIGNVSLNSSKIMNRVHVK